MSFVYSSHLGLHAQMTILLVFGIVGTISFCAVEWSFKKKAASQSLKPKDSGDKLQIDVHSD